VKKSVFGRLKPAFQHIFTFWPVIAVAAGREFSLLMSAGWQAYRPIGL
jgi:hypothetical protein